MIRFTLHLITLSLVLLFISQCTSTRWVIVDHHAVDPREEPVKVDSSYFFHLDTELDPANPSIRLHLHQVDKLQYTRRVLIERTIQPYSPSWEFAIPSLLGSSLLMTAANSDLLAPGLSGKQSLAFNTAGTALFLFSITHLRPSGEAIRTDERRYLRESDNIIMSDSTGEFTSAELDFRILIRYGDEILYENRFDFIPEEGRSVNLAQLFGNQDLTGSEPGVVSIRIESSEEVITDEISIRDFMRPMFRITSPTAELRNRPVYDDRPPLTILGPPSELQLVEATSGQWVEVRFGGSSLYIAGDAGEVVWRADRAVADAQVITVEEAPFGSISIEYSVPVLREEYASDAALVLSNHRNNQVGLRHHLERDLRLMELYFRDAFQISRDRLINRSIENRSSADRLISDLEVDPESTLFIYLSGFAEVETTAREEEEERRVLWIHRSEAGTERVDLESFLVRIADKRPGKIILFADLEFIFPESGNRSSWGDNHNGVLRQLASRIEQAVPKSALIFSNRPGQTSGLFESVQFDNKFHHLFPYFLAEGLQQRRTGLEELVRHISSQVDFTSRQLHDRAQSVEHFGDLSIDLSE